MSFEDTRWDIEQTVIQPLRDFRQKVAPLNQLHNDCVNQFATIVGGLLTGSDGNTAFQGQGSMAMADKVGMFLDGEEQLSGSGNDLMGRLLDAALIGEKRAQELEQRLNEIATERDHTVEMLSGAALTMDGGAVVQGGVDVPWDLVALGLTGVAALAAATRNLDAIKVQDAESARSLEIMLWENDMESGPNTEPLNKLPPDPKGPSGDFGGFLKMMGITLGAAGVVLAAGAIIINSNLPVDPQKKVSQLTPQELDLLKTYLADTLGCSPTQIQKIIDQVKAQNPSTAQLQRLLQTLKIAWQLKTLQGQLENSGYPGANRFLHENVNGDAKSIERDIKNGNWMTWNDTDIRGWQYNADSATYQYQVAQALNARNIESKPPEIGADVTGSDNIAYELKNSTVTQGDSNYGKLIEQLKQYVDEQPDNVRGVGVVVNPGSDRNLAGELLAALKARFGDDPNIRRLSNITVKFMPYNPPDPPSNRWCKM